MTIAQSRGPALLESAGTELRDAAHPRCEQCAHCGQRVPRGLVRRGGERQFCCNGCEVAFDVIHSCGLDRYYALRAASDQTEGSAGPVRSTSKRYAEYDDPMFRELYCRELPGGKMSTELFLQGVHCGACVWLVERLPRVVSGVIEVRLDLRRALVRIVWDDAAVRLSRVARVLDEIGYPPHPARDAGSRDARKREDRGMLIRIGVAGACAGNVMLLALALYAGMFDTMEREYTSLFRWISMGLSVVSLAWPGSVFFRGAWGAIRMRTLHLDVPIALGLGVGALWGVMNTVRGVGEVYFDSLSVLVFALLVGRWIQRRQQRWAADSVELLFSLTPTSARIIEVDAQGGEIVREVPIEAVASGAIVDVRAGDSIPVDGIVIDGNSMVDASLLTGESQPLTVRCGDVVAAGAVNLAGRLRVRVEATGEATRVGKLMRMVEEGARRRAPIVTLADRMAGGFIVVMLALAAITVAAWLVIDPSRPGAAIDHAAALLIVTCPCGLGLATPLAMTVAIGRAARRGILVKGGDALERLAKPGTVFLDKTGTVTYGRMTVARWCGDQSVKPLVAAIEAGSSHPIAVALTRDLGTPAEALSVNATSTVGGGIEGEVSGRHVVVGSVEFVSSRASSGQKWASVAAVSLTGDGLTPVLVAVDGVIVAAAGIGDVVREEAAGAVAWLRERGWRVRLLSGDHRHTVARIGASLGIAGDEALGGVSPEEKLAMVSAAVQERRGTVVMIGDGVNDAAALAAADVGVAVHGGAEASLAAADVYLNQPGLAAVGDLFFASRRTMGVIRRNVAASLVYNVVAAALCVTGMINPLLAAIIMPASSLTVVALSVRGQTFPKRGERA